MDTPQILVYNPSNRVVSLAGGGLEYAFGVRGANSVSDVLKSGIFDPANQGQPVLLLVFPAFPSPELSEFLTFIKRYKSSLPVWLVVSSPGQLDTILTARKGLYSRCLLEKDLERLLQDWLSKRSTGQPGLIITHPSAA